MDLWGYFSTTVTIMAIVVVVLKLLPVPFFDGSATTLVLPTVGSQEAVARSLALVIGNPTATLDTQNVHRFLFKDGTSVDWLSLPPTFQPMYHVVALKTIVLGFFTHTTPMEQALKIQAEFISRGHHVQVVEQPDPACPVGSVVLVLSDAFDPSGSGYGAALLIRKHAFRIGGQRPKIGSPF